MTSLTPTQTVVLSIEISTQLYEKLIQVAASYTEDAARFTLDELAKDYVRRMIEDEVDDPAVIDDDLPNPHDAFREAWGEAMRGEGVLAEEFWESLDDE